MKSTKILWVIPKWTFPITDGARVATDSLVRNLVSHGAEIDILCLPQSDEVINVNEMYNSWKVKDIKVIPRKLNTQNKITLYLKNLFLKPFTPLTISSFNDSEIVDEINNTFKDKKYDYLMLDGLHLAAPFIKFNNFNKPVFINKIAYRAHNIEMDLWDKAAKDNKNIFKKIFLKYQYYLMKKFELTVLKSSDLIAAIANEDLVKVKQLTKSKSILVPLGLKFGNKIQLRTADDNKIKILFVGKLDWPPNKDGLDWFLQNVWEKAVLINKKLHLEVVGSGNREWLTKYKNLANLKITGFVDKIEDAYANSDYTIVPIFYGSGTRIKVIETFALGRPLISTSMGVQGSGLTEDHYSNVETEDDWVNFLGNLSSHEPKLLEKMEKGFKKLSVELEEKNVALTFYKEL